MIEAIVIVESSADAQTATKLAERVLVEEVDWLEHEQLQYLFQWNGLKEDTAHTCWKDINQITNSLKQYSGFRPPRYIGHGKNGPLKADGAASIKVLRIVRFLQKARQIRAVLFIRDLDNQPQRREGIEQARAQHTAQKPNLSIIVGTADRMREAWVLNGFLPLDPREESILQSITAQLTFDPCREAHRLRSNSTDRNPKIVLRQLTNGDSLREKKCWEKTKLELLRERGVCTGLTAYLQEVEKRLTPAIFERKLDSG